MLVELTIEDLALIERASLQFGEGLNVISGETGAGKSLLIDALELLLGERAKSGLIRRGAERARVEGFFRLTLDDYGSQVQSWLAENLPETLEDLDPESEELELILTRTLSTDKRSRAHVNHRPVTQRLLRQLALQLVEIHGQNDHQKLLDPAEQRRLLDLFASAKEFLDRYRITRSAWFEKAESLRTWHQGESDRLQRLDLLRFQSAELIDANPREGELEELLSEREKLRHSGELGSELAQLCFDICEADSAAMDVLRRAENRMDTWALRISELEEPAQEIRSAVAHLEEALSTLQSFASGVETDPSRLLEVEERVHQLQQLQRKYGTDMKGLVRRAEEIGEELAELESDAQSSESQAHEVEQERVHLERASKELDSVRKKVRKRLQTAVHSSLKDLGLEGASFEVQIEERHAQSDLENASLSNFENLKRRFGYGGVSTVEFLLAANQGEPRQPLRRVASGGEMARIMLALRGALSVKKSTPTLIFDEVDTGVGGRLGPQLGRHLSRLAHHHQVLCVTHLPAIAAAADTHLKVEKSTQKGRTRTSVSTLEGEARVQEIADMIAGGADQSTARAEARRLLKR